MNHQLKTVNPHFSAVANGEKTAELRCDDRMYQVGDALLLREYCPDAGYSGRTETVIVTHVLRGFQGLVDGWVMLSFQKHSSVVLRAKAAEVVAELRERAEQASNGEDWDAREASALADAADLVAKKLGVAP